MGQPWIPSGGTGRRILVRGGRTNYGQLVGILMTDSIIPRIPGDPGHAETFGFPVRYAVLKGFPFNDLVEIRKDHLDILVRAAKSLEQEGVKFIASDCGLFSPFQIDLSRELRVPFIGSALDLVSIISKFLPPDRKVGVITGDTSLLREGHLWAAGADLARVVVSGMEDSREFRRVVIERGLELDVDEMRAGVVEAAARFREAPIGAVILECTNLISFRADVQKLLGLPVFDLVNLIEFFASGYRIKTFESEYL
jgi:aspartate/glutamate racemase